VPLQGTTDTDQQSIAKSGIGGQDNALPLDITASIMALAFVVKHSTQTVIKHNLGTTRDDKSQWYE
jgi:hypothetical protein